MAVPLVRRKSQTIFSCLIYDLKDFILFKSLFVAGNFKIPSLLAPFFKNVSEPSRQRSTFAINRQG